MHYAETCPGHCLGSLGCCYAPALMEQLCSYLSSFVYCTALCCGCCWWLRLASYQLVYTARFMSFQSSCDMVIDCNLSQLVSQPTHIAGNTLELVLTTVPAVIEALRVHPLSDCPLSTGHFMVNFLACREKPLCCDVVHVQHLLLYLTTQGRLGRAVQLSPRPGLQKITWKQ